ncbi:MAG: GNAT family N-acetyltransferase, partial [Gammaproteobacteria bacterium]
MPAPTNHNSMNIRQATEDDLPSILNLYAQPSIDNGEKLSLEQAKALFVVMATYPDYKLYLAEINDRPVGTFALLIMHNLGHMGAPSGLVESVAVTPDQHGQGIGK